MTGEQITLFESSEAELRRDCGIDRSVKHADRTVSNWSNLAYSFMADFIRTNRNPFMVEDVRKYAEVSGLAIPPSRRAWGAVTMRAKRNNLIRACGFRQTNNPNAHKTPATLWVAV